MGGGNGGPPDKPQAEAWRGAVLVTALPPAGLVRMGRLRLTPRRTRGELGMPTRGALS